MRISKVKEPNIPVGNPWDEDKLERKKVASYLTPIIASIRQPFVLSLHAPYGGGKSYFLKAWRQDLEGQGYKTAYFNAWETDFSQDPLSAFMSSLERQLVVGGDEKGTRQKVADVIGKASGFVAKRTLPLLARTVVRKVIGSDGEKELVETFSLSEDELSDLASEITKEAMESQRAAEQSIVDFRTALEQLVEGLVFDEHDEDKRKLIVMIDELDRCRPTYSIEVLEFVKHFFSVRRVVFIIAVDDAQLQSAIRSVYGSGFDAQGYLKRFFEWQFKLPEPSLHSFAKYVFESLDTFNGIDTTLSRSFTLLFKWSSVASGLTLRDIERCATELDLAVRTSNDCSEFEIGILPYLSALRVHDSGALYECMMDFEKFEQFFLDHESLFLDQMGAAERSDWQYIRERVLGAFLSRSQSMLLSDRLDNLQKEIESLVERDRVSKSGQDHSATIRSLRLRQRETANIIAYSYPDSPAYGGLDSYAKFANHVLEGVREIQFGQN